MRERAKKFIYLISEKKLTVSTAAIILGLSYSVSNVLGIARDVLMAARFGADHMTDIFYASFKIPEIMFNLIVLGAVASAFIPVYVDHLTEKKKDESNFIASNFLNFLLLIMIVLGSVVFLLAWKLVPLLLPGLFREGIEADFNTLRVTVWSVRIMLLSPILFSISAIFGGILNSHKKFVSYALAPVVYNISIIFGIIFLSPLADPPVFGILYGVIIGAFLHAAIQLIPVINSGFRWKPVLDLRKYELPKIIKLTIPRLFAMGAQQVNILVDTIIASFFAGGITYLTYANNIQTAPTVIFGIAIATAVFPLLVEQKAKGVTDDFRKTLSESTRKILYYLVPASVGIWILRAQIIRLIYGVSWFTWPIVDKTSFTWENTIWTTKTLGFFAIGIAAQGLIPLFLRAFYAIKDTKTPLVISIITMIVNIIFAVTLPFIAVLELEVAGVALAFSIAGFVNISLLYILLQGKIGRIDKDNKIFSTVTKIFVCSLVMGLLVHYSLRFFNLFIDNTKVTGLLMQTTGAIAIGAGFYFLVTYLFRLEETGRIFRRSPQA